MKRQKKLSDQLRRIIKDSELSQYRIALDSDVDKSQLSRFLHGTGRLTTDSLDRIGKTLGLRFVVDE